MTGPTSQPVHEEFLDATVAVAAGFVTLLAVGFIAWRVGWWVLVVPAFAVLVVGGIAAFRGGPSRWTVRLLGKLVGRVGHFWYVRGMSWSATALPPAELANDLDWREWGRDRIARDVGFERVDMFYTLAPEWTGDTPSLIEAVLLTDPGLVAS